MQKPIAPRLRKLLRIDGTGLDQLVSLALDAAAGAALKGIDIPGYYPGAGGPAVAWENVCSIRKADLRGLSGSTLARVSALAWRVYKIRDALPYPRPPLSVDWNRG